MVAFFDGSKVDDGTAREIGYAFAKGKPVIGIRTDFRNAGDTEYGRVNATIEGSCVGIARDSEGVLELLNGLME